MRATQQSTIRLFLTFRLTPEWIFFCQSPSHLNILNTPLIPLGNTNYSHTIFCLAMVKFPSVDLMLTPIKTLFGKTEKVHSHHGANMITSTRTRNTQSPLWKFSHTSILSAEYKIFICENNASEKMCSKQSIKHITTTLSLTKVSIPELNLTPNITPK